MEQGAFEVGRKYRKEEILEHYKEFDEIDFTDKRNGRPVLRVKRGEQVYEFVQDGRKYKLT